MNPLTLSQIAQFAGASLSSGDGTVVVNKVSTDSRTIKPGELFVALSGENFEGHNFIEAGANSHFCVRPIRCKPTRRWQPITGGRSR
jgi:UDP-N-acetylmuramyl pentapeptide synthase